MVTNWNGETFRNVPSFWAPFVLRFCAHYLFVSMPLRLFYVIDDDDDVYDLVGTDGNCESFKILLFPPLWFMRVLWLCLLFVHHLYMFMALWLLSIAANEVYNWGWRFGLCQTWSLSARPATLLVYSFMQLFMLKFGHDFWKYLFACFSFPNG